MRWLLLALLAWFALPARAEGPVVADGFELTLELAPAAPRVGDRVWWVARLRNVSGKGVEVPAELPSWMHVVATHEPPVPSANDAAIEPGPQQRLANLIAEWRVLPPGGAIEVAGEVEACRRGCPNGALNLRVSLVPPRPIPTLDSGPRRYPPPMRLLREVEIVSDAHHVLERWDATAAQITGLRARPAKDAMVVTLQVQNTSDQPIWVPKPATFYVSGCSYKLVSGAGAGYGKGVTVGFGLRDGTRVDKASTKDWVRLEPGRSVEGNVRCAIAVAAKDQGTVSLHVQAPLPGEWSAGFTPPFVWLGDAELTGVPLR